MMNDTPSLYILRHGLAVGGGYAGHDDDLRPLSAEGRRRLGLTARLLASVGMPCSLILASPLLRAVQTAEIIAEGLGSGPRLDPGDRLIVDERLRSGCRLSDLTALLADRGAAHQHIMMVGHEPDLSLFIRTLTGGVVVMQPGTLARVDLTRGERRLHGEHGRLVWLLQPEMVPGVPVSG